MNAFINDCLQANIEVEQGVSLAKYTTWKVGGPAEYFYIAKSTTELITLVKLAKAHQIPTLILGGGSNVLIADQGISGLVIINKSSEIVISEDSSDAKSLITEETPHARLDQVHAQEYYNFAELDYTEPANTELQNVWLDSGVVLSYAINILIQKGLTGLQWFARIPGTVGGAVYNNIHGGSHFISEYVNRVEILNENNEIHMLTKEELDFDYDLSRFHNSNEVILRVELALYKGDKQKAQETARSWAIKKSLQPSNSAGCCYQNISETDKLRLNLPANGWGYIIEHTLKLKGKSIGGASISTKHAAFIETTAQSTAEDVLELLKLVTSESDRVLGIKPKLEIVLLGFKADEISELNQIS